MVTASALGDALTRQRHLVGLPPQVALFYSRARRLAARRGDAWSLRSATPPRSLAYLLREARGARRVVEVGTGTAWTATAAALADPRRRIVTYDPVVRPERDWYLALAGATVRARIELVEGHGESGPSGDTAPVDFVFLDGSHRREGTIEAFEVWREALAHDGAIAFHDWRNESYPGVTEAIEQLGLRGKTCHDVFVWRP